MKECEEFAPLLSAFVDGELTEEERAEVLAHVSECVFNDTAPTEIYTLSLPDALPI